jgi:hypothetical protein
MFQDAGSESMKTGRAPQYRMGLQLPTKVSDQQQCEVDRRRTGAQRRRVADADERRELALEAVHVGAERRDPVAAERLFDERRLFFSEVRRGKPDPLRQFAPQHQVHRPPLRIHDGNMVDQVLVEEGERSANRFLFADGDGRLSGQRGDEGGLRHVREHGPAQVAIGEGAPQLARAVQDQQDAFGGPLQRVQRITHRARGGDAQALELLFVHRTLLAGTPA